MVEYNGVVPILGISPDQYHHLLTALTTVGTAIVIASEFAYYVSRVFIVTALVATLFAELGRVDFIRDYVRDVRDVLMK